MTYKLYFFSSMPSVPDNASQNIQDGDQAQQPLSLQQPLSATQNIQGDGQAQHPLSMQKPLAATQNIQDGGQAQQILSMQQPPITTPILSQQQLPHSHMPTHMHPYFYSQTSQPTAGFYPYLKPF